MKINHEMNKHHRINVWRIADKCPVCGEDRDYSPGNPNGIECYCSNDNCAYSERFSNTFIHENGTKNDNARFEVVAHIQSGQAVQNQVNQLIMMFGKVLENQNTILDALNLQGKT
jgi:hypothetical protein